RQGALCRRHRHRIARPDVRDPGRDDQAATPGEEQRRAREGLAPDRFGNPERAEAEVLDFARRGLRFLGRKHVEESPNSDLAELHLRVPPRGSRYDGRPSTLRGRQAGRYDATRRKMSATRGKTAANALTVALFPSDRRRSADTRRETDA